MYNPTTAQRIIVTQDGTTVTPKLILVPFPVPVPETELLEKIVILPEALELGIVVMTPTALPLPLALYELEVVVVELVEVAFVAAVVLFAVDVELEPEAVVELPVDVVLLEPPNMSSNMSEKKLPIPELDEEVLFVVLLPEDEKDVLLLPEDEGADVVLFVLLFPEEEDGLVAFALLEAEMGAVSFPGRPLAGSGFPVLRGTNVLE